MMAPRTFYRKRSLLFHFVGLAVALGTFSCTSHRLNTIPTVDPNATAETKALFTKLWILAGSNRTLFGHQDDNLYGVNWRLDPGRSDVLETSGSYPAVYGFELGQLELGGPANDEGVPFALVHDRIIEAYQRGGVITISWHMSNPVTGGNFYDVTAAVSTILPGGSNHERYLQWLHAFADFDRSLTASTQWNPDQHLVPVILRLFHEHNCSHFWWGRRNPDAPSKNTTEAEYMALWRFTEDYLRDVEGLHNLLYAYSPDAGCLAAQTSYNTSDTSDFQTGYFFGYPGDDYIDVLGLDYYQNRFAARPGIDDDALHGLEWFKTNLNMLVRTARHRSTPKVPALTETGGQAWSRPNGQFWWTRFLYPALTGTRRSGGQVAWALVWRNSDSTDGDYGAPFPHQVSEADFMDFKNKRAILFQDEIPPITLYSWP